MEVVLGIDLGTSYFKLGLFDRRGRLRGLGRVPVEVERGDGSRCELTVERFISQLENSFRQACRDAGIRPADIAGVSYSSQANSFVLLDDSYRPLTHLVLWPDRRAERIDPVVRALWRRPDFRAVTGVGLESGEFCVNKLRWYQQYEPEIWARTRRVMTISDYLVFLLTGKTCGDAGTASLLGIWDVRRNEWWADGVDALGLSRTQLSALLRPGSVVGPTSEMAYGFLSLPSGVPVAVGGLDHHIAAIGAGVGRLAPFSESIGTVLACLRHTDEYRPAAGCCVGPAGVGARYYSFAFNDNGASGLEWYRNVHAQERSFDDLIRSAEQIAIGSDGLIALPDIHRSQGLAGFKNVTSEHREGHFVRAILELTAANLMQLVESLCGERRPERIVATGGGARSPLWLQIHADVLNAELVTSRCSEPACLGAALLAAVAAGWYSNVEEAADSWIQIEKHYPPAPERHEAYLRWLERHRQA